MEEFVVCSDAQNWIKTLPDNSVDLLLFDPPYFEIVKDSWDNQWRDPDHYVSWMLQLLRSAKSKMKEKSSIIFFGGTGKHGAHPLFKLILEIEKEELYHYRNLITWSKRRAYGKSHDYLFCREEIVWFSISSERTEVTFNIPLLEEKRGYAGYNKKYPAKSEYKRVSNVWTDIGELFTPERYTQKPIPLMNRLIQTHSNQGDLIVDPFCGYGSTGISAIRLGRKFLGCEAIKEDAEKANQRINEEFEQFNCVVKVDD